ncbi:MAG: ferrous iron transport protein A [Lachnospiraceae bacterium]
MYFLCVRDESKRFLENLGFTVGERIRVVSSNNGNIIVQVKDSRVAVSRGIANKIMI